MVNLEVGARLRNARRGRGLALADVEARSGGEFKSSVVGAYERGERTLSVTRLLRLARIYGVSPSALLDDVELTPLDLADESDATGVIDLVAEEAAEARVADTERELPRGPGPALTIELSLLDERVHLESAARFLLGSFVRDVMRLRRGPVSGRSLTIRADDVRVMALALGIDAGELSRIAGDFPAGAGDEPEVVTGQPDATSDTRP